MSKEKSPQLAQKQKKNVTGRKSRVRPVPPLTPVRRLQPVELGKPLPSESRAILNIISGFAELILARNPGLRSIIEQGKAKAREVSPVAEVQDETNKPAS